MTHTVWIFINHHHCSSHFCWDAQDQLLSSRLHLYQLPWSNQVAPLAGCICQHFQTILLQAAIHQPEPEFWIILVPFGGIAGAIAPRMLRWEHQNVSHVKHGKGYEKMARIINMFEWKEFIPPNPQVLSYYQKNSQTNNQNLDFGYNSPLILWGLVSNLT